MPAALPDFAALRGLAPDKAATSLTSIYRWLQRSSKADVINAFDPWAEYMRRLADDPLVMASGEIASQMVDVAIQMLQKADPGAIQDGTLRVRFSFVESWCVDFLWLVAGSPSACSPAAPFVQHVDDALAFNPSSLLTAQQRALTEQVRRALRSGAIGDAAHATTLSPQLVQALAAEPSALPILRELCTAPSAPLLPLETAQALTDFWMTRGPPSMRCDALSQLYVTNLELVEAATESLVLRLHARPGLMGLAAGALLSLSPWRRRSSPLDVGLASGDATPPAKRQAIRAREGRVGGVGEGRVAGLAGLEQASLQAWELLSALMPELAPLVGAARVSMALGRALYARLWRLALDETLSPDTGPGTGTGTDTSTGTGTGTSGSDGGNNGTTQGCSGAPLTLLRLMNACGLDTCAQLDSRTGLDTCGSHRRSAVAVANGVGAAVSDVTASEEEEEVAIHASELRRLRWALALSRRPPALEMISSECRRLLWVAETRAEEAVGAWEQAVEICREVSRRDEAEQSEMGGGIAVAERADGAADEGFESEEEEGATLEQLLAAQAASARARADSLAAEQETHQIAQSAAIHEQRARVQIWRTVAVSSGWAHAAMLHLVSHSPPLDSGAPCKTGDGPSAHESLCFVVWCVCPESHVLTASLMAEMPANRPGGEEIASRHGVNGPGGEEMASRHGINRPGGEEASCRAVDGFAHAEIMAWLVGTLPLLMDAARGPQLTSHEASAGTPVPTPMLTPALPFAPTATSASECNTGVSIEKIASIASACLIGRGAHPILFWQAMLAATAVAAAPASWLYGVVQVMRHQAIARAGSAGGTGSCERPDELDGWLMEWMWQLLSHALGMADHSRQGNARSSSDGGNSRCPDQSDGHGSCGQQPAAKALADAVAAAVELLADQRMDMGGTVPAGGAVSQLRSDAVTSDDELLENLRLIREAAGSIRGP